MSRISLLLFFALTACKKEVAPVVAANADTEQGRMAPAMSSSNSADLDAAMGRLVENFQRVHFGFDEHTLGDDSKEALDANAAILARHGGLAVEIQGHADERGTTDYNLALGQRRADAVRTYLISRGASGTQLTAVSYGEERPMAEGSGEVVFSQNRRAEFRITVSDGVVQGTTR